MRLLNRSVNGVAGRLSRRRRGPLAGLMVLLLGLILTGTVYAAFSPATAQKAGKSDEQLIQQGRELFLVGCAFCHGQNGEGITSTKGQYGPSLVGVGAAAVDFQVGTGRMPMAQPGQQAASKKETYTQDEIDALAAYVASLGPGPAIPDPGGLHARGPLRGREARRDLQGRPALPHQLHRVPQLRRLGRCAPPRPLRPDA